MRVPVRSMIAAFGETDPAEQVLGDRAGFGLGQPLHLDQAEHHVLGRGHVREQVEALEHHADAGPLRGQPVLRDALAPAAVVDVADRVAIDGDAALLEVLRSEEHTSELQSLMRISYAVFCLKNKTKTIQIPTYIPSDIFHSKTKHGMSIQKPVLN